MCSSSVNHYRFAWKLLWPSSIIKRDVGHVHAQARSRRCKRCSAQELRAVLALILVSEMFKLWRPPRPTIISQSLGFNSGLRSSVRLFCVKV